MSTHNVAMKMRAADPEQVLPHDHDHQQRNIGYQDAIDDFKECMKVVGYCNDAPLFWLKHGRNWREHL